MSNLSAFWLDADSHTRGYFGGACKGQFAQFPHDHANLKGLVTTIDGHWSRFVRHADQLSVYINRSQGVFDRTTDVLYEDELQLPHDSEQDDELAQSTAITTCGSVTSGQTCPYAVFQNA